MDNLPTGNLEAQLQWNSNRLQFAHARPPFTRQPDPRLKREPRLKTSIFIISHETLCPSRTNAKRQLPAERPIDRQERWRQGSAALLPPSVGRLQSARHCHSSPMGRPAELARYARRQPTRPKVSAVGTRRNGMDAVRLLQAGAASETWAPVQLGPRLRPQAAGPNVWPNYRECVPARLLAAEPARPLARLVPLPGRLLSVWSAPKR
mgnify:CR=1 FL=1